MRWDPGINGHLLFCNTFFKQADSLSVGEDAFDVDADGALWRVLAAHNCEPKTLLSRPFLEGHILDAVALALPLAW